jgi:hypothetical protein
MSSSNEPSVHPLPFADVPQLELFAEMASVDLVRLEPGASPRLECPPDSPLTPTIERQGDKVVVHLGFKDTSFFAFWGFRFRKGTHAVLYLPDELIATAHTEMGRVHAENLNVNSLELSTSAGAVILRNVKGKLKLTSQAGKIAGTGLAGSFEAETQAGSIALQVDALAPGVHKATTQMGKVAVVLASGIDVRIDAHTEVGKTRVDYPSKDDAPAVLKLSTQMGAVRVYESGREPPDRDSLHEIHEQHRRRHGHGRHPRHHGWPVDFNVDVDLGNWGFRGQSWTPNQESAPRAPAGPELRKVLDLVAEGKLSAQDAEDLLKAMGHTL